MATSTLNKVIHDLKLVYTALSPTGTINAHGGAGVTLAPTAPDGYKFLAHLSVWNTGIVGLVVSFDGAYLLGETVNVYQNNTTNGTVSRGKINLLSLYYK